MSLSSKFDIKELLRENALIIDFVESLLVMAVAFGLPLHGDQESYIVAALVAAVGLVKAFTTRPFAAAAVTDFGRALLVVLASFGVGLSADQIAVAITSLGLLTSLVLRAQITPRQDPVIALHGAGAGPVKNEAGAVRFGTGSNNILNALGVLLLVVAVILLLTTVFGAYAVSPVALIVLAVVGLALVILF